MKTFDEAVDKLLPPMKSMEDVQKVIDNITIKYNYREEMAASTTLKKYVEAQVNMIMLRVCLGGDPILAATTPLFVAMHLGLSIGLEMGRED